ncbi:hypothetical protein [Ruminiclostridium cellobioparum]|jgi:hypothetical protein|uniref:hypothetical protein n=1 Tax=Ruminiclostridium cellobioparum TaxID=29355 RepID=UPI0028AA25C3|nr:hypothetical protein [Ruminiclostridium cellobioparum]
MSGKRKALGKIDFKAFVDVFNTQGKTAAVKHVTDTYGVRYDTIVKRLRQDSEYIFDQSRDRYVLKMGNNLESPFLTVEELCNNEKPKIQYTNTINSTEIIFNLIKDKFFEVSKYVTLENSSRKITLKLDAARNAGYDIEYV